MRVVSLTGLLLVSLVVTGCGPSRPKTVEVTGTVTYQGQPVEGARVMFDCKTGRPASGTTDAAGHFALETFSAEDGAIIGEHRVAVSKYVDASGGAAPEVGHERMHSGALPVRQVLPKRYTTPATSPLKAAVTAEGPNDFTFDLTN